MSHALEILFWIYIFVALFGLSLSILSFIFGGGAEDTDTDFHVDADHIDADHVDGGQGGITVSHIFSLRNFLLFFVGFGAAGAEAVNAGYTGWQSSGFGFTGGIILAYLGFLFYRAIGKQQGNSAPKLAALVGKHALVVTAIPASGYGEIRTENEFGATVTLGARSEDCDIKDGSNVEILAVVANTATVRAIA